MEQLQEKLADIISSAIKKELISIQENMNSFNKDIVDLKKTKQKRSLDEKIQIGKEAYQEQNNSQIARRYNINEKTVRKYKEIYLEHIKGSNRKVEKVKRNRKMKPKYLETEKSLIQWIFESRKKGICLHYKDITEKAKKLCPDLNFSASSGWFEKFKKRWNLSHRTATHVMTKCGQQILNDIESFLKQLQEYRLEISKQSKQIIFFNIDETPIQFGNEYTTYDEVGKKEILARGVSNQKKRFTAVLMINSRNDIFPPLIIGKGSKYKFYSNQYSDQSLYVCNENSWITEELYLLFLKSTIANMKYDKEKFVLCLIHDTCTSHTKDSVQKFLQDQNIKEFQLPGGSTSFIQVLDVVFNKPFKDYVKQEYHNYLKSEIEKNEDATKIKSPQYDTVIQWVLKSLNNFNKDIIQKGFKYCGVNLNLDNSEQNLLNPKLSKIELVTQQIDEDMKANDISKCEEYQQRIKQIGIDQDGVSYELPLNLEQIIESNGDLLQVQEEDSSGESQFENDDQPSSDCDSQPQSNNDSQHKNGSDSEEAIELINKKPKIENIIENKQSQNEMEIEIQEDETKKTNEMEEEEISNFPNIFQMNQQNSKQNLNYFLNKYIVENNKQKNKKLPKNTQPYSNDIRNYLKK